MVMIMATGGSTNAVLHIIAMAKSAGIEITIEDFQKVSDRVPFLADMKPSGQYVMEDVQNIGGTPALMKYLIEKNLFDDSQMTCSGKTIAQNLESLPGNPTPPHSNPFHPTFHSTCVTWTVFFFTLSSF